MATDRKPPQPVAGPLGRRIRLLHTPNGFDDYKLDAATRRNSKGEPTADANGLILLRRLAVLPEADSKALVGAIHLWAAKNLIGFGTRNDVITPVQNRREALLAHWRAHGAAARLRMNIEWRLATGLGLQYGVLDNGIALHGTYGWPVIPASTLKGLARAGSSGQESQVKWLLGHSDADESAAGAVTFLDAFPENITVHRDVITPHQQPYYSDPGTNEDGSKKDRTAPGEHHNPIPLPFLSLSGTMTIDLLGHAKSDLDQVTEWLNKAGDDIGIGGRITAGYGYFRVERIDSPTAPGKETA